MATVPANVSNGLEGYAALAQGAVVDRFGFERGDDRRGSVVRVEVVARYNSAGDLQVDHAVGKAAALEALEDYRGQVQSIVIDRQGDRVGAALEALQVLAQAERPLAGGDDDFVDPVGELEPPILDGDLRLCQIAEHPVHVRHFFHGSPGLDKTLHPPRRLRLS